MTNKIISTTITTRISYIVFFCVLSLCFFHGCSSTSSNAEKTKKSIGPREFFATRIATIDCTKIDPLNEGKLVCFTGIPTVDSTHSDEEFGVTAKGAIRLKRVVEMFQWKEQKHVRKTKRLNPIITYSYSKIWYNGVLDSKKFENHRNENPVEKPLENKFWDSENVSIGEFKLFKFQIKELANWSYVPLSMVRKLPEKWVKTNGFVCRVSKDSQDTIGDVRIKYYAVYPKEYTLAGKQTGNQLRPLPLVYGDRVRQIAEGVHSAASLIQGKN